MFKPVNTRQNFPEMESATTSFWKKNKIFQKSVEERDADNRYVFYDGPPFITGTPRYGSLLPSIAKDVVPRYQTMNGKRVERVWGWDAHGMPIETKVEKELGIENRRDVEKYGLQEFIDKCYEYTRNTSAEWKWYIEKIGRWVDFDNSYKTMDQDYMESVMWVFRELWDKGFIYEGIRTSLFDTKLGTPISNFEIAMDNSYQNVEDPAVTIKFPVTSEGKFKGVKILAWTTTPWTLPANKALVVDPEEEYIQIKVGDEQLILAAKRAQFILTEIQYETVDSFKGEVLLGLAYEPPFNFIAPGKNDHLVYAFPGMVHMEEGTGVVHSAPGFGDIDTDMGKANELTINIDVVTDEGKYSDIISDYKGVYVKKADNQIIEDLKSANRLFKVERISHRYPIGPRSGIPLIHRAQHSWFINIDKIRKQLIENNEHINWVPGHLKHGRFKKGIETAPDWGISRTRFWSTPIPVWQLEKDGQIVERVVIGSRDELRERSIQPITKIVFVRHAKRDKSIADGELNAEGLEQVEQLKQRLVDHKFDAIFSSATKRAVQTVADIASKASLEVKQEEAFGNLSDRAEFDEIEARLIKEHDVESLGDIKEEILIDAFSGLIQKLEKQLKDFLSNHKGESLLVSTHSERISMIRHIVEGRRLNDAFAMEVPYAGSVTLYFNGDQLLDLHRPKIDSITIKGEKGELTRVKEVLDVWMDSGSMPYAAKHYPFENKEKFEADYPADFIVEYIGQTRAWFYVMHVLSAALMQQPSFKNVVTTGVIFGTDGRKMSKSYGNYPDPKLILEKYGAEPLRMYLMGSSIMVGDDMNIDEEGIREQLKSFILPLWNSYAFFVTYANMHDWQPLASLASNLRNPDPENKVSFWDHIPFKNIDNKLDTWIIARLQLTIRNVRIAMDDYNIPAAVKEFPEFIDDLSRWYIRRSRDRFAEGDIAALNTLYYILVEFAKLIAPVAPFLSEAIYQNLVAQKVTDAKESIHLTDYPHPDIKFMENSEKLLVQMDKVREIVNLGQSLRVKNSVKVRQPLAEIEIKTEIDQDRDYDIEQWMKDLITDELNIKLAQETQTIVEKKGWIKETDESKDIEINIDFNLTEELKREGTMRELIRSIQNLRKKSGLQMGEQISIAIFTEDKEVLLAIDLLKKDLLQAVSAIEVQIEKEPLEQSVSVEVNENPVHLLIKKV